MSGGAKKKSSKKTSKKSSKKASKKSSKKASNKTSNEMLGGKKQKKEKNKTSSAGKKKTNPGFQAFLDFKKSIATKLDVPNSPKVGKLAGIVQKEIKEKNPNMEASEVYKKSYELFESNVEKYRKML